MYVGWDWASERHDVSVVDQDGKVVFHTGVEHPEAGLGSILRRLCRFGEPAELPVAIERPSGLVRCDDQVQARVTATNQRAALLDAHWPGAGAIFGRLDSEIALAFPESYPKPESAARLGEQRMARLQSAPVAPNRLDPEVLRELVLAQVRLLRTLLASIASPDRALDVEQAAAECGASPVTKASGTSKSVCFRWAANTRARKALPPFADHSRHRSPWAAQVYAQTRGKRHPHAIRLLMRAWLRVIWACWHSGIPDDPVCHGGEQGAAA